MQTRRTFLRGSAGLLALAAAPRAAGAGGLTDRRLPGATRDYKVLEIHFAGALCHRETWWVEQPDAIQRGLTGWNPAADPILTSGAPGDWLAALPTTDAYLGSGYQVGAAGTRAIHLGPCAAPLVRGTSLVPRMRVVATGHDAPVHEPAQQLMQQGAPATTSASRASGLGAPIARHTGLPSFVFFDSTFHDSRNTAEYAAAAGRHGAEHAPILIPFDDPAIVTLLDVARDPDRDSLGDWYAADYAAGLTFHPSSSAPGVLARSVAFDRYQNARGIGMDGTSLAAILAPLAASGARTLWDNGARRAIRASVELLRTGRAAYCGVVDGGVAGVNPFSRYDAHEGTLGEHAAWNTGNVLSVLRTLREEIDAGRLNLDDTLVVFNTEFGRSYSDGTGSEHCWQGFAVAFLGGPIAAGLGGVVGDLPFASASPPPASEAENPARATGGVRAGIGVQPTDLRAAVLQAAGIHPFQTDTFEVGESGAVATTAPDDAADLIASHLFGV